MRKQLTDLRRRMVQEKIDAYLIPSDDFHGSEYVGDHFKCRGYVSGFTGSAGTLLVTADWAGLWTDGRYFLQAAQQLDGSGITLCKMGEKNVPTEEAYLKETLRPGQCLGFDGRTVTSKRFHALETALDGLDITFRTDVDLAGDGWPNRPPLSAAPAWALDEAYCGRSGRKSWHRSAAFYRNGRPMSCCFLLWMTSPGCSICAAGMWLAARWC